MLASRRAEGLSPERGRQGAGRGAGERRTMLEVDAKAFVAGAQKSAPSTYNRVAHFFAHELTSIKIQKLVLSQFSIVYA